LFRRGFLALNASNFGVKEVSRLLIISKQACLVLVQDKYSNINVLG
jgi:hypothetical protein